MPRAAEWLQGWVCELASVGFAPKMLSVLLGLVLLLPGGLQESPPLRLIGKSVPIPLLMEHSPAGKGALLLTAGKSLALLCRSDTACPTACISQPRLGSLPRDPGRQHGVLGDRSCRRRAQPCTALPVRLGAV